MPPRLPNSQLLNSMPRGATFQPPLLVERPETVIELDPEPLTLITVYLLPQLPPTLKTRLLDASKKLRSAAKAMMGVLPAVGSDAKVIRPEKEALSSGSGLLDQPNSPKVPEIGYKRCLHWCWAFQKIQELPGSQVV